MRDVGIVESYIHELARQSDLFPCWDGLTERLAVYGFDRIIYGSREDASKKTIANHANSIVLSTYGPELDKGFVDSRLYIDSPSVRWALENEGAYSWGETEARHQKGQLSKNELQVYEVTRALGISAGYSYSLPDRKTGIRSCFGMCFRDGGSQAEADQVWARSGAEIAQLLNLFEVAVTRFRDIPDGQILQPSTLKILKLAAEGRTVSEIAELLGNHRRTVEDHLLRARTILGAANTAQAVFIARQQGQI